jgi:signal transduction histidine kinase
MGLGLAIVYRIIENHRGTITAASVEGAGSVFTIALPVARGGAEQLPDGEEKTPYG